MLMLCQLAWNPLRYLIKYSGDSVRVLVSSIFYTFGVIIKEINTTKSSQAFVAGAVIVH